ncbi:MAG: cysteine--tRNA ligase [Deltaproteobacteria bacterium]|jgi:cysteinyl-tRNA synthetase|nr:cysteine--tRNA ligase [Deltaproteobacteria bacterium]
MKIYSSLTRKKEDFVPLNGNNVKMYVCGVTVYSDCHVGHARQAIVFDMITEYLRYKGYNVKCVGNYTDVDDKIIAGANAAGINALEYSAGKILETKKDMQALKIRENDIKVKASETIPEIIDFITQLIKKGYAYPVANGDVYFSVRSFPNYGKLSNRNPDELIHGVRKDVEEGKHDQLDFALWKSAKPNEISWDSPWGKGRPGWHIECSAMCLHNLGETLDIHGGGRDLIFPHHENEIAQSMALTGKPLAKYWVHNGLITVNGQKMSKSLGSIITIKEALKLYHPETIKYMMLSVQYASDVDWTTERLELAEKQLYYFYTTLQRIDEYLKSNVKKVNGEEKNLQPQVEASLEGSKKQAQGIKDFFEKAMDDDFNTPVAFSNIFTVCKYCNGLLSKSNKNTADLMQELVEIRRALIEVYAVVGILQEEPSQFILQLRSKYIQLNNLDVQQIENLISERLAAKQTNDYAKADALRKQLEGLGVVVNDTQGKVAWELKQLL